MISSSGFARSSLTKALLPALPILLGLAPFFAQGQTAPVSTTSPDASPNVDENGVDVMFGTWNHNADAHLDDPDGSGLSVGRYWSGVGNGWASSLTYSLSISAGQVIVTAGAKSISFLISQPYNGTFLERFPEGNVLSFDNVSGRYKLVDRDGTQYILDTSMSSKAIDSTTGLPMYAYATSIVYPSGRSLSLSYDVTFTPAGTSKPTVNLRGLTSTTGFGIRVVTSGSSTTVMQYDTAYDYCPFDAQSCNLSLNRPTLTYSTSISPSNINQYIDSVSDSNSNQWVYTRSKRNLIAGYARPSSAINTTTMLWGSINTNNGNGITSITHDGVTHAYQYLDSFGAGGVILTRTAIVTDGDGKTRKFMGSPNNSIDSEFSLISLVDEIGTTYQYSKNRLQSVTYPEGNSISYTYDDRRNLTSEVHFQKGGAGPSQTMLTAFYPPNCDNSFTCNKPVWTRDALLNQTDYTYSPDHGGLLTETGPPDAAGVRPQMRYFYIQRYAWVSDGAGSYVHSGNPIWLLSSESRCRRSAATGNQGAPCSGGDEILTTYEYGPDGGPNNLALRGFSVAADGVSVRTCYGYDQFARRIEETRPRAGLTSCP